MSKLVSTEFQSWDSLYWPEGVPRYVDASLPPPDAVLSGREGWAYSSGDRSMGLRDLANLASSIEAVLGKRGSHCVSIQGSDLAAGLLAELLVLTGKASVDLALSADPACSLRAALRPGSGELSLTEVGADSWTPPPGSHYLSIAARDGRRILYKAEALWGDAVSLSKFLGLEGIAGVAVIGSASGEFELSAAAASLAAGVRLLYSPSAAPPGQYSAAFVGASAVGSVDGRLPRGLSFVGVEGPVEAGVTKRMERDAGAPVLQMYGVSGRGILFSNPRDFNVHGSAGIAITNVEAVISEVLEASWYRGRRMLGPGEEGELAVKAPFIDIDFNAGDPRQRRIQVRVAGKNQPWLGVGVMGKMDENGYLYPEGRSFLQGV
ncbi:MAG: hypothetical protein ACP5ID_00015 [Conexivisphaera sp.]